MAKNKHLNQAKIAKKDEFYTRYEDIANEIEEYYKYNPSFLKDKTVLLPCDDHKKSNFVKYFSDNFERFGVKKLIATGISLDGKGSSYFLRNKLKVIRKSDDGNAYGDFRNKYVTALRDEADVIFTNPPFSLFREFYTWCKGKEFSIIGNLNAISYNEVFPSLKEDKAWIGCYEGRRVTGFTLPDNYEFYGTEVRVINGERVIRTNNCCWFTNIEHSKRHLKIDTVTQDVGMSLLKKAQHIKTAYKKYSNADGIEVPMVKCLLDDYKGVMGVPVSYCIKHNPAQFEIVGRENGPVVMGEKIYKRILIKHRAID